MTWVSGNSVKIDGTRTDPLVHTDAVAVNSVYAPATSTVPIMVGLSQAAAQAALTAANLTLGTVTVEASSTPAGTVINQSPLPGTVEPVGSSVNLTVSNGSIVVPGVVGLRQSSAISALRAAGLGGPTLHTTIDPNCNEAIGTVVGQNPSAGALEPAGFSVNLQIEAWPNQGCSNN
jgi:beta-lactam-binding protein with PASTA domain